MRRRVVDSCEPGVRRFGLLVEAIQGPSDPVSIGLAERLSEDCKQAGEISCKESWYRCPNPRTVPETPEEIRTACADDLFTLARQIIADGVSLTRIASNVATSKGARSPAGIIRRYLTRNQTAAAHVRTVTRQLIEMIEAEKPRRAKRKTEPDNVVRLASGVAS